jgi:hypothetical protein
MSTRNLEDYAHKVLSCEAVEIPLGPMFSESIIQTLLTVLTADGDRVAK